jgi:hypothetical protein
MPTRLILASLNTADMQGITANAPRCFAAL